MNGSLNKMASGHSSYEIAHADQNDMFAIAKILAEKFHFEMGTAPMVGGDGVYWNAQKGKIKLTLGWDVWSGIFIMSYCDSGDKFVAKIGRYLDHIE